NAPPISYTRDPVTNLFTFWVVNQQNLMSTGQALKFPHMAGFTVSSYSYPYQTTDFRILRRPRILTGQEPLALRTDVAIDVTYNFKAPVANQVVDPNVTRSILPGFTGVVQFAGMGVPGVGNVPSYDIQFSPSGEVFLRNAPANSSKIILWVRDTSL